MHGNGFRKIPKRMYAFLWRVESRQTDGCRWEKQNICGAYCVPAYRGKGIMQQFVNHAMGVLRAEGYTKLGVDYESINPTAWKFWNK